LETVEEIYRRFDLPLDDAVVADIQARIDEEPLAQVGEHEYDIADYGLRESEIHDVFADYRQNFGV
jgi:hypothetical protein